MRTRHYRDFVKLTELGEWHPIQQLAELAAGSTQHRSQVSPLDVQGLLKGARAYHKCRPGMKSTAVQCKPPA